MYNTAYIYQRRANWEKRETTNPVARVCNSIQLTRMKMNQKDTGFRALKNQMNTGSSPIEDDDGGFRDVTDPYSGVPEDYVYPQEDYTEAYRRQNLEFSQIALEYYNKTSYQL
ncbi:uncharacterized protein LOC110733005 [Chenopodium quinoa]|uniref:uncharacterized protein LOC110733005 n=1 Tax=Chenopodium quinoa TaxID=63459 RepID=UPI000B790E27|nr:uncharacterized protein LOC110733005 [Chenopodium quinoa]